MSDNRLAFIKLWAVPVGLFVLALIIRGSTLGGFVTIDEPRWLDRSRWFMMGLLAPDQECPPVEWGREFATQGWGCTFQIGYPGVTTMWGGSLGLWLYYWQTGRSVDMPTFLRTLQLYPAIDPAVIAPMRFPFAVVGALFVPLFYLLLRRLLTESVALGAALLVALHPFHIGLSRVIHHDSLNTMFMVLSLLMLIGYWLRRWPWYWLLFSAMMGGLAFLSKQVSWFMIPWVGLLGVVTLYYRWQNSRWQGWPEIWGVMAAGLGWGAVAVLTFVALFPAMWVMPVEVIGVIFTASTKLAEVGQPHYFLGQITQDPGWLFYPVGWVSRATPVEVVGLLAALGAGWPIVRRPRLALKRPVETTLAFFVGLLFLFVTISNKKLARYFLPAFPVIDIFVVMGLFWLVNQLAQWRYGPVIRHWSVPLVSAVILLGQSGLVLEHQPYYFTYYNPLIGGTAGAARFITIEGWGEGLNEAAVYLDHKPAAKSLRVVAEMWCSTFGPFFAGRVNCLNSNAGGILGADYMVYYYNVAQRNLQWLEQWRYFNQHYSPEHRVTLHGLDYVLIYRNPIQNPIDREANSSAGVFTSFGYNLTVEGQLTLFWQNLRGGRQQLSLGLAPSSGRYAVAAPAASALAERQWLPCKPKADFVAEVTTPKAIIESICSLNTAQLSPGLYDLQLGLNDGSVILPLKSSLVGLFLINPKGQFSRVELKQVPIHRISSQADDASP